VKFKCSLETWISSWPLCWREKLARWPQWTSSRSAHHGWSGRCRIGGKKRSGHLQNFPNKLGPCLVSGKKCFFKSNWLKAVILKVVFSIEWEETPLFEQLRRKFWDQDQPWIFYYCSVFVNILLLSPSLSPSLPLYLSLSASLSLLSCTIVFVVLRNPGCQIRRTQK